MSNFPLAYKLSWLPRLLRPSLVGGRRGFLPAEGWLLSLPPENTTRLIFLGDISAVAGNEPPEIDDRLRTFIATADLVVGNCESPVVARARKPLGTAAGTRHAMTPGFLAGVLEAAGIAPSRLVLSLANNHMLDQGPEGYVQTRAALAELGIVTVGGVEDGLLRTIQLEGLTIALTSFTQWRNARPVDFAGRVIVLDDFERQGFAALRAVQADLKCVVPHWDLEFRHFPQPATHRLAQRLVEAGAHIVAGHHAHVLQPAERIADSLVAYGLGDFLGTALPRVPWPGRLGAVLALDLVADGSRKGALAGYRFMPFFRERASRRERLTPLDLVEGKVGTLARARFAAIFPEAAPNTSTEG